MFLFGLLLCHQCMLEQVNELVGELLTLCNVVFKSLLWVCCITLACLLVAECMGSIQPQHRPYLTGLSSVIVSRTDCVLASHSVDLAYSYGLQSILRLAEGKSETFHNALGNIV